jgi:hypothetical protein
VALEGGSTTPKNLNPSIFLFFLPAEPPPMGWFGNPKPAKGVAEPPFFFSSFLLFFIFK